MKTYLEVKDVESMERAANSLRDRLLIRLLFRLGCRVSEALAIRTGDVDFARGTVTILHLKHRIRLLCPNCKASLGKRHDFCPGCGKQVAEVVQRQQEHRRVRILPIDKHTLEILQEYQGHASFNTTAKYRKVAGEEHRKWYEHLWREDDAVN